MKSLIKTKKENLSVKHQLKWKIKKPSFLEGMIS